VRNPGETLTDETYTLFQRWVALPEDFLRTEAPMAEVFYNFGSLVSLAEIESLHRFDQVAGDLRHYAVGPNPTGPGEALFLYPSFDSQQCVDFLYRARRRDLKVTGHESAESQGTISISGTAITGSGTAFSTTWAGSLLRISGSSSRPTGLEGANPYREERLISAVGGTTSMTLRTTGTTQSGVGYRVTDYLDIDRHCWAYFYRLAERYLCRLRFDKALPAAERAVMQAMMQARGADVKALPKGCAMQRGKTTITRLSDMVSG
jgi:hypothetical protein